MTSAWCQTLHFHPTNGWPALLHWIQATLSSMCLSDTAGQPGPCWSKPRESSACRKHWTSGRTKTHTHTHPTHALLSHVLAGYSIMHLLLQWQLETLPPQWWPSPLATLGNPGRNLKPTFWVSEEFFFQNKSQHWSWIKYSKLFYHAALQQSPQVRL